VVMEGWGEGVGQDRSRGEERCAAGVEDSEVDSEGC
jgi:hypothetical protein